MDTFVPAADSVTSPRRGEVDARSAPGEGGGYTEGPEPPHPTPLPCGERELAVLVALPSYTTKYPSRIAST
jgi:hypothetical protein